MPTREEIMAAIKQMGLQPPKQKRQKTSVVFERKARSTGATIRVLDNRQQQWFEWDDAGGYAEKWWTECTTHGFTCSHERRAHAVSWASQPEMWCDECRKIARSRGKID